MEYNSPSLVAIMNKEPFDVENELEKICKTFKQRLKPAFLFDSNGQVISIGEACFYEDNDNKGVFYPDEKTQIMEHDLSKASAIQIGNDKVSINGARNCSHGISHCHF